VAAGAVIRLYWDRRPPAPTSTTFRLSRGDGLEREWRLVTVRPMSCPMFRDLPLDVALLVDDGWQLVSHVDDGGR
jgi:hypothetical protein